MLMIRFQRIGRRNDPSFRMVVTEKTAGPKAGKFVDLVGTYNPKTKVSTINADRIKYWMSTGAQVSPSLMNLLIKKDVLKGDKINVLPKKSPIKKEGDETKASSETPAEKTESTEKESKTEEKKEVAEVAA